MEVCDDGADLSGARQRMAELEATTRRMRLENRCLQAELFLARSHEAVAARLLQGQELAGDDRAHEDTSPASLSRTGANRGEYQKEMQKVLACLRPNDELQALREQVNKMRQLFDHGFPIAPHHLERCEREAVASDADRTSTEVDRSEAGHGVESRSVSDMTNSKPTAEGSDNFDLPALLSESSFEMLATLGEVDLAEQKKELQGFARRCKEDLAELDIAISRAPAPHQAASVCSDVGGVIVGGMGADTERPADAGAATAVRRHRRRVEQMGAIAARLHEEYMRRRPVSGTTTPMSVAASEPVMNVKVSHRPFENPVDVSARSQFSPAPSEMSLARSATSEVRMRNIRGLSRRFLVRRDL
eukprot:TRINITY_DN55018_c0_g1_i1.p1 TRINITY_DN55018_c0_g1~~TRINITY_DN55018_c0_g1_i1.p1  ORF type:complete len:374 (-),score=74.20 TRINITY_DN55018_c0_g1_i1:31-1110(-)